MIGILIALYAVGLFAFVYLDGRYDMLDRDTVSDYWVLYFLWPVVLPLIGAYRLGNWAFERGKKKRSGK